MALPRERRRENERGRSRRPLVGRLRIEEDTCARCDDDLRS
ncbi:MAG: hypothetical protein ABWK00_05890 [Desulfurococcaceae archaeon]